MDNSTHPGGNTDKTARSSSFQLLKRLVIHYVAPYRSKLFLSVLCMTLAAAATAANAWLMQPVLDKIFLEKNATMLWIIPAAVIVIGLVKSCAAYGQSLIMKTMGQRIVADMQMELYQHLLKADIALFNEHSSGRLLSRFTNDIMMIRRAVSQALVSVAREFLTLIFLIGVMLYQSLELSIIALVVFPLAIYPLLRLAKRMRKLSDSTQDELGNYTARLDDTFHAIRVVKAYARETYEAVRSRAVVERLLQLYYKTARVESISSPMMEALSAVAIAGVIAYGGAAVIAGTTSPGAFFSFITAFIMAYRPVRAMTGLGSNLQEGMAAADRLFKMLDTKPRITDPENAKTLAPQSITVGFENVSFHYVPGTPALEEINFSIRSGERIALVGESGSGKSTLFQLLLRFYDPASGSILINDTDIRQYSLSSLRGAIGFVNQEATLFDDTVRANIAYGKPDASEDEILSAAYNASAHDFIVNLPDGYDTMVGQQGLRLSGGQRQRIAIARAMLKDAPLLLLDEATSALDPISEHQVQTALDKLMKGRTTLVIAHRLSTIIEAQKIYVMKAGRIIESGKHTELLKKGGEYARLYERQFQSQRSDDTSK